MSLNSTPNSERVHIGIFGKTNAGKSSLINAITGQDLAIVSKISGTTTDPVSKAMELLPLGPVVMIDTPGLDDNSELGVQRIEKSYEVLDRTDIAVLLVDGVAGVDQTELDLLTRIEEKKIPHIIVVNKSEQLDDITRERIAHQIPKGKHLIFVSAQTGEHISELKEMMAAQLAKQEQEKHIIADLLEPEDIVVLVVPIDSAAPKGRLILPQQQTIRDILGAGAQAIVTRETELKAAFASLKKPPKMVVTDSQAFALVSGDTPKEVLLTSFSILFSRYKGNLKNQIQGVKALDKLKDRDKILISEGCTHHRQCDDIGTVKLPKWILEYTGKKVEFVYTSGMTFPKNLSDYAMVVHCGGCMLNEREMKSRIAVAAQHGVPMTNYGMVIAYVHGILKRSLEVFPEIAQILE